MKIQKNFILLVLLIFISCSTNKTLVKYTSPSKYQLKVYQNKKDNGRLTFSFKNGSDKKIQYTYRLYTLGNILYIYTPSGKKLRYVDASGTKNDLQPNQTYAISLTSFDEHLLMNLKATETGWYKCIWRIEHLDVQTEFLYYFDYEKTKQKYLPD